MINFPYDRGDNLNYNEHILYAKITHDSGVYKVYLNENRTFYLDEIPNISFEIRDNRIAFIKSDCPDQICVRTGFLGRVGQISACLPNGTVLMISDSNDF